MPRRLPDRERLETRLTALKSDASRLEEQGAARETDNQAAVLARFLSLEPARIERGLMLFLAVLVEVGAALGLFLATGHVRPAGSSLPNRGRGVTIIEGFLKSYFFGRQTIAANGSRSRLPRHGAYLANKLSVRSTPTTERRTEETWAT